ncbi:MAG: hypothetical protein ACR2PF_01400 [Rhizobiaceae bacterium]
MANQWKMTSTSFAFNENYTKHDGLARILPYDLDINVLMDSSDDPGNLLGKAAKQKIHDLVINCHGAAGACNFGSGLDWRNAHKFKQIAGKVERIFFASCNVASTKKKEGGDRFDGDGFYFCRNIAHWSKAHVFASKELQGQSAKVDKGHIRAMNGPVWEFFPEWTKEPDKKWPWWDPE